MFSKRNASVAAALFCAGTLIAQPLFGAQADPAKDYPSKPIRLIVPFTPGAGTDTTARLIAKKLSEMWNQQVIVDNRTGAAGAIAVQLTSQANPDGYTICLISASQSVNSAVNTKLPFDLTKDLQGITQATSLFYAMYVNPAVPAKSVKELIAYAKANPGKLNFGSSGTGAAGALRGRDVQYMAGVKITHVPYKGAASGDHRQSRRRGPARLRDAVRRAAAMGGGAAARARHHRRQAFTRGA